MARPCRRARMCLSGDLPYDERVSVPGTLSLQHPPVADDDWIALSEQPLSVGDAYGWALRPDCGAVVVFSGTARDHSEGRPGVTDLAYEAYESAAMSRMGAVVAELRGRWSSVSRVAVLHRLGEVPIGQEAVVVVVSAPHREDAFAAARFAIDAVKASVPVWKRERWDGGDGWGLDAQHLVEPAEVSTDVSTDVSADDAGTDEVQDAVGSAVPMVAELRS